MPAPTWTRDDWFDWLIDRPFKVILTIALAIIIRWLLHRFIDRVVHRAGNGAVPSVLATTRAAGFLRELSKSSRERRDLRAKTVGSLLKSIVSAVVLIITLVMIFDLVGLPIAPLLTGAGVLGVAVGFGAQSLVRDFLSGMFMILEDQYAVGDTVELSYGWFSSTGTVESVGLRLTQVRDANGTVLYVRNGEVLRVGNLSQQWSQTVLDVTVSTASDIEQAEQILREEAAELFHQSALSEVIIAEPEVRGVERFDADGVVIRTVITTAPQHEAAVARALRSRLLRRLAEANVQIISAETPEGT